MQRPGKQHFKSKEHQVQSSKTVREKQQKGRNRLKGLT